MDISRSILARTGSFGGIEKIMNLIFNLQYRASSTYENGDNEYGQYCCNCNGMVGTLEKRTWGILGSSYIYLEYMCSPFDVLVHGADAEDADIKCSKYKKLELKKL